MDGERMVNASASRPGSGALVFEREGERTVLRQVLAHSPLRVVTPRNHGHGSWAYLSSFGGGFVDGDSVELTLNVREGATAFVSTQGPGRVYRSPNGCENRVTARVGAGALLALLPDPLALFSGARFEQHLDWALEPGASLLAWDVLSAGRVATGERWAFDRLSSTLRIRSEREWVRETLLLDSEAGPIPGRLGRFEAFANVVIAGPRLAPFAAAWLDEGNAALSRRSELVSATSPLAPGAWIARFAATSVEGLTSHLRSAVRFLPELLGDDPLSRRA